MRQIVSQIPGMKMDQHGLALSMTTIVCRRVEAGKAPPTGSTPPGELDIGGSTSNHYLHLHQPITAGIGSQRLVAAVVVANNLLCQGLF